MGRTEVGELLLHSTTHTHTKISFQSQHRKQVKVRGAANISTQQKKCTPGGITKPSASYREARAIMCLARDSMIHTRVTVHPHGIHTSYRHLKYICMAHTRVTVHLHGIHTSYRPSAWHTPESQTSPIHLNDIHTSEK